ncbi:hypothetical protein LOC54_08795 [Acetobacter sp. AN02]|uniref:hypothetical protein n=1 Tax=Acetobacter sp. AN02 TaxID=2894186 RepID=UPI00243431EC|nr:hypothetical protein [Acetobacter sp. AN02]MDG6095198.1 hypothetical protein [Acetobacter sp. AN02]
MRSSCRPGARRMFSFEQNRRSSGFSLSAAGIAAALVLAVCLVRFCLMIRSGLSGMTFADEADHILGSQILGRGGTLYGSYVDQHGPLIFMIGRLYGAVAGWMHPIGVRLVMAGLAMLCAALIALELRPRLLAVLSGLSLFFGLLASFWLMQGLYLFSYYPVAGFLAVLMMAAGMPVFRDGGYGRREAPSRAEAFSAGLCAAGLGLASFSYGPSAVLFAAAIVAGTPSGSRGRVLLCGLAGGVACLGAGLLWMLEYGSLRGWHAFHIYYNRTVYAPFIHFGPMSFLGGLWPSVLPERRIGTFVQLALVLCCGLLMRRSGWRGSRILAVLCLFTAVELLNARGDAGFKAGAQLVAVIGLVSLVLPDGAIRLITRYRLPFLLAAPGLVLMLAGADVLVRHTPSSPFRWSWKQMMSLPPISPYRRAEWPEFVRIRELAGADGRILALPFRPEVYLAADRLPPDRYYEYLPWDAIYARRPYPGEERDICRDLQRLKPAVIIYRPWKTDMYPPGSYLGCVLSLLRADYREDPDFSGIYGLVRKQGGIEPE